MSGEPPPSGKAGREPSREGGDTPSALQRRIARPPAEPLSARQGALAGAFVGALYAGGMIARDEVLPGIVGGVLAAILCFLVLREIGQRQRRRIAEYRRRHGER